MSTFCTFETEYRLTKIDQSLRRLSLSFTRCNSRIPRDFFGCHLSVSQWTHAVTGEPHPVWFHEDPHRTAYAEETLMRPTVPLYEAFNPAMAEVSSEHVFSIAMFDVMNNGMTPEQAIDKAFKRAEGIFAKYPIAQG